MAELKTKPTSASVAAFIKKVPDKTRREDCQTVVQLMSEITKEKPQMWGSSIVGFGKYRYQYGSGREGEWPITGFSPRKGDLTLYIMGGFDSAPELMSKLGKYKTGKACLYIKKLGDVDLGVLRKLVSKSVKTMEARRIRS